MKEFKEILNRKGYSFKEVKNKIVVTNQGDVYLESLTTLPEGVKFENQGYVYLESLTTLPEGVKFTNQGDVYLRSLTTLPEGVKFENQGYVYLESLTTLPKGVKFENQGNVNLRSLTTLPKGVKFENQGNVYLRSLTGKYFVGNDNKVQLSETPNVQVVDGYAMIVKSRKKRGDFTILNTEYLGCRTKSIVAERGGLYAHGDTIKEAIEDVSFKYLQQNSDVSEIVSTILRTKKISVSQFRLITGACGQGCKNFLNSHNIKETEMDLNKALPLLKGQYGWERLSEQLNLQEA